MNPHSIRSAAAAAAGVLQLAGALAVAVWPAAAAATPPARSVLVTVSARGSQATTWRLARSAQAQGCTIRTQLDGSQMIRFATAAPEQVTVTQSGAPSALWNYAGTERPVLPPVTMNATAEREAEMVSDLAVYNRSGCVRTVPGQRQAMPGCGTRHGTINLLLAFTAVHSSSDGDEDDPPLAPLIDAENHLRLSGVHPDFGIGALSAMFAGCPLFDSPVSPEALGHLLDAWAHVSEQRLLAGRTVVVHAGSVTPISGFPGVTGQTVVSYNVTLRPVRQRAPRRR